jgi:hypothetical protein
VTKKAIPKPRAKQGARGSRLQLKKADGEHTKEEAKEVVAQDVPEV